MQTSIAAMMAASALVLTSAQQTRAAAPAQTESQQAKKSGGEQKQKAGTPPKNSGKSAGKSLKSVNITSNMFEVMSNAEQAVWTGSVVASQGDLRIECDKLVASFGEHHRIKTIDCQGHVHMVQKSEADPASGKKAKDREAWGDKAHFDNARSVITVTGNPAARDCKNTVRGEKVLVYVADERIVVEKPRMVFDTTDAVGDSL